VEGQTTRSSRHRHRHRHRRERSISETDEPRPVQVFAMEGASLFDHTYEYVRTYVFMYARIMYVWVCVCLEIHAIIWTHDGDTKRHHQH
jgi:hypothetical protein